MIDNQTWSWILGFVGVFGFFFAGRKVWWSWYINIAAQALWVTYAIVTTQWGFIASAAVYTVIFIRNAIIWTADRFKPPAKEYGGWVDQSTKVLSLTEEQLAEIEEFMREKGMHEWRNVGEAPTQSD